MVKFKSKSGLCLHAITQALFSCGIPYAINGATYASVSVKYKHGNNAISALNGAGLTLNNVYHIGKHIVFNVA